MPSHRRADDEQEYEHERQSNGNGNIKRLWAALGLSLSVVGVMLVIMMGQHGTIERNQTDGAVRDAELRQDMAAQRQRLDAIEKRLDDRAPVIEGMQRQLERLGVRQDQVFDTLYGPKKRER